MSRTVQPEGSRGSLKWIQRAVNLRPELLNAAILPALRRARTINWLSPLASDNFAEYRDGDFLELIDLGMMRDQLRAFWPDKGPQWDALGRSELGDILLVEAKAHINEIFSPATAAGEISREKIIRALNETITACGAKPKAAWTDTFYQLANRLAHLHFLRSRGIPAWLVLVNFVGDRDMGGPSRKEEWETAYRVVQHVLGINSRSPLAPFIVHIFPDISQL